MQMLSKKNVQYNFLQFVHSAVTSDWKRISLSFLKLFSDTIMRMIFGLQFHNICFLLLLILIAIVWLSDENEENLKKKVSKLTSENNQLKMLVKRFDSENKLRYKKKIDNKMANNINITRASIASIHVNEKIVKAIRVVNKTTGKVNHKLKPIFALKMVNAGIGRVFSIAKFFPSRDKLTAGV